MEDSTTDLCDRRRVDPSFEEMLAAALGVEKRRRTDSGPWQHKHRPTALAAVPMARKTWIGLGVLPPDLAAVLRVS